jgi:hypothetical protein
MHLVEAVRQLRGQAADRQAGAPEVAMYCSSHGFVKAAASVLSTSQEVGA